MPGQQVGVAGAEVPRQVEDRTAEGPRLRAQDLAQLGAELWVQAALAGGSEGLRMNAQIDAHRGVFLHLSGGRSQLALEAKVLLDMLRERVIDLCMSWDRLLLPRGRVDIDVMAGAMAHQHTAGRAELTDEFARFIGRALLSGHPLGRPPGPSSDRHL